MPNFVIALVAVGVYALFWLISRWHNIALPTRKLLKAQIEGVRSRLYTETLTEDVGEFTKGLEDQLTGISNSQNLDGFLNFIFWSRGQPIAGWTEVHSIERQLVEVYSLERVKTYLAVAEADLRKIDSGDAGALANTIQSLNLFPQADAPPDTLPTQINTRLQEIFLEALGTENPPPPQEPTAEQISNLNSLRALLQEALRIIYDHYDTEYARLVTWHNKAAWLMVVSLTAIFSILMFQTGSAWLLGVGAVGGLVSRLTRSLKEREAIPTDYGAYWTSFYLSPVFGALAAWAGILLVVGLTEFNLLTGPFERVQWGNFSYNDGIFSYITNPEPTSPAGLTNNQPLTVNFQAQFSFSSNAQPTATQEINPTNSETATDENSNEEDPNKNVLLTLALALLFGFSERRLTQLTGQLDRAFEPKEEKVNT